MSAAAKKGTLHAVRAKVPSETKSWPERSFEERIRHVATNQCDDHSDPLAGTLSTAVIDLHLAISAIESDQDDFMREEIVDSLLRVKYRIMAVRDEMRRLDLEEGKAAK